MEAWDRTSFIAACVLNTAMTTKRRRAIQPHEINPMAKKAPKRRLSSQETTSTLRAMAGLRLRPES